MALKLNNKRKVGQFYEALAASYLEQQGLTILTKNAHVRIGEIDLICQDKLTLVFVEVKYRRSARYGCAIEAISPQKKRKWRQAAEIWLHQQNLTEHEWDCRFDLVAIDGDPAQITWLPNVLLE
jgi:putative endonuclease